MTIRASPVLAIWSDSRFGTIPAIEGKTLRYRLYWIGAGFCLCALVAIIVLAVSAATSGTPRSGSPPPTSPPALGVGTRAPAFNLPRLGGGPPVSLSAVAHGRPVILNFWASWCTDCQAELAAFARASHQLAGKVSFVGIDTSETDPRAALALEHHAGIAYPTGFAADETVADSYLVGALPETFFIDSAGRIRSFVPGKETLAGLLSTAGSLMRSGS